MGADGDRERRVPYLREDGEMVELLCLYPGNGAPQHARCEVGVSIGEQDEITAHALESPLERVDLAEPSPGKLAHMDG